MKKAQAVNMKLGALKIAPKARLSPESAARIRIKANIRLGKREDAMGNKY